MNSPGIQFRLRTLMFALLLICAILAVGLKIYEWATRVPTLPLKDAVADFNEWAAGNVVGKSEPPLTEAEFVAAIRRQLPTLKAPSEVKAMLAQIANTRTIQVTDRIYGMSSFEDGKTSKPVWWINLHVSKKGPFIFALRVRENNSPVATTNKSGEVLISE